MLIFGHRGVRGDAPENTIPGFRYAVRHGLRAVEFDVHGTRDGRLAVIHDDTVDRTTTSCGPVAGYTLAELRELDARADFPNWPEPCGVPGLDDVLDVVGHLAAMEVEIKTARPELLEWAIPLLLDTLRTRGLEDRAIITSFDSVALAMIRELRPDYPQRALIASFDSSDDIDRALDLRCVRANIYGDGSSPAIVAAAKAAGLRVGGGPCNDRDALAKRQMWGYEWVTSDYPLRLL